MRQHRFNVLDNDQIYAPAEPARRDLPAERSGAFVEIAGMPGAAEARPHLDVIDGLRGAAILGIVVYHLTPVGSHIGVVGRRVEIEPLIAIVANAVSVFFFISGFLLYYPTARHSIDGKPEPSIGSFYRRRFWKIVPSYVLSSVAAIALGAAHFVSSADAFAQIATHLTFTYSFFATTYGGINGVLWSLAIEAQFYLIFPLVRAAGRRSFVPTVAALAVAALLYRVYCGVLFGRGNFTTYQLPGLLDLFAAGMATAYAYRAAIARGWSARLSPRAWTGLAVLAGGVELALLATISSGPERLLPGSAPLVDLNGTAQAFALSAFTFASFFAVPGWRRLLANRCAVFAAAVSYNLYLWHKVIGDVIRAHSRLTPAEFACTSIVLSLAIATILTYRFEQPLIALGKRAARPLRVSTSGSTVT
ncbi:MAG: hypothetical protein NVS3B16_14790 [Vulcanimicrobiaceae bacterium]